MGNSHGAARAGAAAQQAGAPPAAPDSGPFEVEPFAMPFAPPIAALRVTSEAIALHEPEEDGGRLVRLFPFFKILYWSYSPDYFSWRMLLEDEDLPTGRSTGDSGSERRGDGGGGGDSGGGRASEEPGQSASTPAPAPAPASLSSQQMTRAFLVKTGEGKTIEGVVMASVLRLMSSMEARGVPDALFAELVNTLQALADEGHADRCLHAVKQMALSRAFTTKQAATLVATIGMISPFEKVEAAVALYPTLLSSEDAAFVLLLQECFEDEADRDNVAHRLGFKIGEVGSLEPLRPVRTTGAR